MKTIRKVLVIAGMVISGSIMFNIITMGPSAVFAGSQ